MGEIFDIIPCPFFLSFCSEIEKENQNVFISSSKIYLEYLGEIKRGDKNEISLLKYFDVNKVRDTVPKFLWLWPHFNWTLGRLSKTTERIFSAKGVSKKSA